MTTSRRKRTTAGRISASRRAVAGRRTGARPTKKAKPAKTAKATAARKPKKQAKKTAVKSARKPAARKKNIKLSPENAATKKRLEAQVKAISKEIDRADALAKSALKAAEKRTFAVIKKLRSDRARLQTRLKTLTSQGESAFDEVKIGVEAAYQDLSEAIVKAIGHLK